MAESKVQIVISAKDNASGVLGKIGGALGGLGKIAMTGLAVGAAAGVAGVVGLGAALADCVAAASEAQDVQSQLQAVLRSTGGVAGVTADMVNGLASSLQETTRFEDDMIIKGENMLLTFTNIGRDIFPQATETMLDMSQALGQDVTMSAMQLGKALNDPIGGVSALRRVGVQFTDEQEKMVAGMVEAGDVAGAQAMILAELSREFGGSAVAAGTTFAGKLDILKNKLGDVKETIGGALLPVLSDLADKYVMPLAEKVQQAADQFAAWAPNIQVIVDALAQGNVQISTGQPVLDEFLKFWQGLVPIVTDFANQMQLILPPAMESVNNSLTRIGTVLGLTTTDVTAADVALAAVKGTLDAVKIGVELAAVGMDWLATAVENVTKFVNEGIEGWQKFSDAVQFFNRVAPAGATAAVPGVGAGVTGPGYGRTFQYGGVVPGTGPQLAVVHGGETVVPAGGGAPQIIQLVVDGRVLAEVVSGLQGRGARQLSRMGGHARI